MNQTKLDELRQALRESIARFPGAKPGGWSFVGTLEEAVTAIRESSPFANKDEVVRIVQEAMNGRIGYSVAVIETMSGLPALVAVKVGGDELSSSNWQETAEQLAAGTYQFMAGVPRRSTDEDQTEMIWTGLRELASIRQASFGIQSLEDYMLAYALGDYQSSLNVAGRIMAAAVDESAAFGGALITAKADYDKVAYGVGRVWAAIDALKQQEPESALARLLEVLLVGIEEPEVLVQGYLAVANGSGDTATNQVENLLDIEVEPQVQAFEPQPALDVELLEEQPEHLADRTATAETNS